ncbi:MAG: hypothetical protein J6M62_10400 [Selenomonadaceae bacterium]|nr:hypothetical protein [Selenomonadaceae bacterium]
MGAGAAFLAASALSVGSQVSNALQSYRNSKFEARQYKLQSEELELQKEVLTDQYRTKRNQLIGNAVAQAAASGVKVSGSVASSISNSLTEMGMEESYRKFNLSMEQNNLAFEAKAAKAQGKQARIAGLIGAATTALSSYSTYDYYWGSRPKVVDVTGQGTTGGNVKFVNGSYRG